MTTLTISEMVEDKKSFVLLETDDDTLSNFMKNNDLKIVMKRPGLEPNEFGTILRYVSLVDGKMKVSIEPLA